ncbi:MAG: AMP-binding protein [Spirochaetales bacterium]|nr:AMP-binding protein [Spirochaetales bacterium]MCF7939110.1 AMP-binding protein [Spirochaetales bacterium]
MDQTLTKLFRRVSRENPDINAQLSKDETGTFQPVRFDELYREVSRFGAGLLKIGVQRDDHVGLVSDNRREWLVADFAVMGIGAIDVPRGCDASVDELEYILSFADCSTIIVENMKQYERLKEMIAGIKQAERLIILDASVETMPDPPNNSVSMYGYQELIRRGKEAIESDPEIFEREVEKGELKDVATIIFTSGTTGEPKGAMLKQEGFINQTLGVPQLLTVKPGDIWLSVLPVWHSFERMMQYVAISGISTLSYSKPIGKIMLEDFAKVRPTWMASVPRIWEALMSGIYRKVNSGSPVKRSLFHFFVNVGAAHAHFKNMVYGLLPRFGPRSRAFDFALGIVPYFVLYPFRMLGNLLVFKTIHEKLGGRFVAGISGGGALPEAVDRFFSAAGVLLLEGYGLTEASPVLGVRDAHHPVTGTVGPKFPNMEYEIRDEEGNILPPGKKGIVFARGPQVMVGYYKKPEETAQVLSEDGWLNTGDLGMFSRDGDLKIVGRAKDTIVLLGGENVEPAPIEEKITESMYIDFAMVVGQDKKYLAALIVPNREMVEEYAGEQNIDELSYEDLLEHPIVQELIHSEISERVNVKNGFKSFELISRFQLLAEPFELGAELSAKQEIKRYKIVEKYAKEIKSLYSR